MNRIEAKSFEIQQTSTKSTDIQSLFYTYGLLIILVLLVVFFSITSSNFLTLENLFNILRQVSIIGICAVGMTYVMLTGGIDLSVGSIIGVTGVGAAKLLLLGIPPIWVAFIMLAVGTIIGLINAFFINEMKIPPLIATLGTMTSWRGLAYIITGGLPVFGFKSSFAKLGQGYLGFIPIPVIFLAVVFVLGIVFLNVTKYGRYIYGVGGNEEASRLSGINIKGIKYLVYSISGFLSGLAGIILLGRINSGQPSAGMGYEMDVITAVVLGGVSISGGEGNLGFVAIGTLLIGVLTNGMIMLNINDYVQQLIKGLVLVAAVGFDRFLQSKKS